jgi:hypothetical protein
LTWATPRRRPRRWWWLTRTRTTVRAVEVVLDRHHLAAQFLDGGVHREPAER